MKIENLTALIMTLFYGMIILGLFIVLRMAFLACGVDSGLLNSALLYIH